MSGRAERGGESRPGGGPGRGRLALRWLPLALLVGISLAALLTGTARLVQEAQERAAAQQHRDAAERRLRDMARRRSALERQIEELKAGLEAAVDEEESLRAEESARGVTREAEQQALIARRSAAE